MVTTYIGMIILIPLHATATEGEAGIDATSMANVPRRSNRMFVHLILVYVLTLLALYVIREAAQVWMRMRERYMTMALPHHHTVLITNVPEGSRSPMQVKAKFAEFYPDVYEVSEIGNNSWFCNFIYQRH